VPLLRVVITGGKGMTEIIGAVIGGIFTLVASALVRDQRRPEKRDDQRRPGGRRGPRSGWPVVGAVVIAVAAAGALGALATSQIVSEDGDVRRTTDDERLIEPNIEFDEPGGPVPHGPRLTGTGSIPDDHELWIVVEAGNHNYYVVAKAARRSRENWHVSECQFGLGVGRPDEAGEVFIVHAVLLARELSEYFESLRIPTGERNIRIDGAFSDRLPPHSGTPATISLTRSSEVNC
jgi:hypothetical protein